MQLDASESRDYDYPEGTDMRSYLSYKWSCVMTSYEYRGVDCTYILGEGRDLTEPTVTIETRPGLIDKETYSVTVVVTSLEEGDDRSGSYSINIEGLPAGSPEVVVQSALTKFNPQQRLKLAGIITGEAG